MDREVENNVSILFVGEICILHFEVQLKTQNKNL